MTFCLAERICGWPYLPRLKTIIAVKNRMLENIFDKFEKIWKTESYVDKVCDCFLLKFNSPNGNGNKYKHI